MGKCKHENRKWLSYIDNVGDAEIAFYECCNCRKIFIDLDEDYEKLINKKI